MSDAGLDVTVVRVEIFTRHSLGLEPSEHAIFWSGIDADQIHDVDDD